MIERRPFFSEKLYLIKGQELIGKIFLHKLHILYLEGPAVQRLQRTGVCRKMETHLIGVQRLTMAAVFAILPLTAVFTVPDERMSGGGKLSADLMGPAGN